MFPSHSRVAFGERRCGQALCSCGRGVRPLCCHCLTLLLTPEDSLAGESRSEGGFADGRYAAASLLDQYETKDSKGRNYYQYEVLVRSADGNEGGRHHIIKATVRCGGTLQDDVLCSVVCVARDDARLGRAEVADRLLERLHCLHLRQWQVCCR